MNEKLRQLRSVATKFETREDGDEHVPHISGYFATFSDVYEIAPGLTESIAPGAFRTDKQAMIFGSISAQIPSNKTEHRY